MGHSRSSPPIPSAQEEVRSPKTLISSHSEGRALSDDLLPSTPTPQCSSLEVAATGGKLKSSCLASDSAVPLSTDSIINSSADLSVSRWLGNEEEKQQLLEEEDNGGGDWDNLFENVTAPPYSLASGGNWRSWPTKCSFVKSDDSFRPSDSSPFDNEPAAFDREIHDFKPLMSQYDTIGTDLKPSTPLGAGLANMGNTCFLNAIFQCFTHTVPFVLGLCSLDQGVPSHHDDEEFCILSAVRDHIFLALSSPGNIMFPCTLVGNLNNISSSFRRHEQEDAHEFLQCVLDKLDTCWSKCNFKGKSESSIVETLVKQVFGGRLVSQLHCCNCGHCSDTYEPLIDLSLEIEDANDLDGALRSFTKVEEIEDAEVRITCDSCKERVPVMKQLMLDQAPSILTFHLKRFKSNGYYVEKINKAVEYPLELDLAPFTVHNESHNVDLKYDLYAVVVHNGWSSTSGHYFCYIRSTPGSWYEFDDSKVINVEPEVALSQRAYILLYARKGTDWPCCLVESLRNYDLWHTSPKSVLDYADPLSHLSSSFTDHSNVVENQDMKQEDPFLHCNETEAVEVCKVGSSFSGEGCTSSEPSVTPLATDEEPKDDENIDEKISKYVEWGTTQSRCHVDSKRAEITAVDVEIVDAKDPVAASSCGYGDAGGDEKLCNDASSVSETNLNCKGSGDLICIDGDDKDSVAANSSGYRATGRDETICKKTSSASETSLGSKGDNEVNFADYHLSSPRTQRPDKCSELLASHRTQRPDKISEELQETTIPANLRDPKRQSQISFGKRLNKRMDQRRKEALRTASRFSRHRHHMFAAAIFSNPGSLRKRRRN